MSYLFFLVEVAGLPVVSAGYPVTADNISYNVLVEYNNLQERIQWNTSTSVDAKAGGHISINILCQNSSSVFTV